MSNSKVEHYSFPARDLDDRQLPDSQKINMARNALGAWDEAGILRAVPNTLRNIAIATAASAGLAIGIMSIPVDKPSSPTPSDHGMQVPAQERAKLNDFVARAASQYTLHRTSQLKPTDLNPSDREELKHLFDNASAFRPSSSTPTPVRAVSPAVRQTRLDR